jgi:hypothetical protein
LSYHFYLYSQPPPPFSLSAFILFCFPMHLLSFGFQPN